MNLQLKILAGYLSIILFFIIINTVLIINIDSVNPVLENLDAGIIDLENSLNLKEMTSKIVYYRIVLEELTLDYILTHDDKFKESYDQTDIKLHLVFDEAIKKSNPEDRIIFENLFETINNIETTEKKIFDLVKEGKDAQAIILLNNQEYHELTESITDFIVIFSNRKQIQSEDVFSNLVDISNDINENKNNLNNLANFATISIPLVIVLSIVTGFFISRSISRPITRLETQIQNQLKELKKIDEQKNEFAAMVSHELKTPLVPIQLYTEMLLKGVFGSLSDKQIKPLHTIHTNIESLNELVDDVLDVTKLELGRLVLYKKQVDVKELLNKNMESLMVLAQEKKVVLELDLKTSGKIFCDPKRINQVLLNLIKNSIDFVPENIGLIKLTVEKNSESFVFTVIDNGPGISVGNQEHLFKKFYQVDTSPTRKHSGSGLGLTICHGLVKSHGGKIWLDEEYTQGTCLKFTIPVVKS